MSLTQRSTFVTVCRIKNIVCCVATGRWKWKVTNRADSLQTDGMMLDCHENPLSDVDAIRGVGHRWGPH